MGDSNENVSSNPVANDSTKTMDKLEEIIKSINDVQLTQNKLISTVDSLREAKSNQDKKFLDIEDQLDTMSKKLAHFSNEYKTLDNKFIQLESKVSELEAFQYNMTQSITDDIHAEIISRHSRRCNLIFFNVPEIRSENNSDIETILRIIQQMNSQLIPINATRLGNFSDKCRPIRVTFPNPQDTYDLLKMKFKLRQTEHFKQVNVSTDRTPIQRKQLKATLGKLAALRSAGEEDLYIRYVNNVPVITKIPPGSCYYANN